MEVAGSDKGTSLQKFSIIIAKTSFIVQTPKVAVHSPKIRDLYYKTFYGRNLRVFVIS